MDNPVLKTAPIDPQYSLDAIKLQANICDDIDDDLLNQYGRAAVERVRSYTCRAIRDTEYIWYLQSFGASSERSLDFYFEKFPYGKPCPPILYLPVLPLKSIVQIRYIDTQGVQQVLAPENYQVDLIHSRIAPTKGNQWPHVANDVFNPIEIEFIAGYAPSSSADLSAVPEKINLVVNMICAYWYENREAFSMLTLKPIPESMLDLLQEFRREEF